MLRKVAILGLWGLTLSLFNNTVFAQNILFETSELNEEKIFFCDNSLDIPTTFINLEKEKESKVFIRWYSEYLMPNDSPQELCQNVSDILNEKAKNNEPIFLAAQPLDNRWKICLVANGDGECDSKESQNLLYLNQIKDRDDQGNLTNKYPNVAKCFVNAYEPQQCESIKTRGTLLSIPSNRYVPNWWPF